MATAEETGQVRDVALAHAPRYRQRRPPPANRSRRRAANGSHRDFATSLPGAPHGRYARSKKEPQAKYALGVVKSLPQLRLIGPDGGVSGDGEPPGRA
jgi:hypothetical protein